MARKLIEIYLEPEDIRRLQEKVRDAGFIGRAAIRQYIEKICREPICFLDTNVKMLLQSINFKI